ncbi:xanthine dehydrogenase accessory protein XdhC [Rhodobacteraceae bacterium 2CG4]|uniref:Xanthine dehydrogenase accessory protein XdhC n=1 Tax=Halovulum marinum TaxID=2662447 RepID=A0A6L5Z3M1_9RHOB|nr:xanthine dehydrogenase accessory protein XdhC [Halovulum marinum]MSU91146.1 xanthine dehydrogenase accessory protein XdhC [Halovulum marinum]
MSLDRPALAQAVAAHGAVARIVVVGHAGSTPRETGTAMLVWQDGQDGTIGGGALEYDATAHARGLLSERAPFARSLLTQPLGPALGQCCGGSVTLLIERITETELAAIPDTGAFARPAASGRAEPPLSVTRALRAARGGRPVAPALLDGWFVEPTTDSPVPVWIWGAGHVGRALVATLAGLPVRVTWVDDARARFPATVPDHADMLVAGDLPRAAAHAPADARHYVLTYSHALDLEICHAILSRPFAQLGLIGSATKKARFLNRLRDLGHPPERLARLDCPIGDPALGKQPQAIAVGVVHALLRDLSAGRSGTGTGIDRDKKAKGHSG